MCVYVYIIYPPPRFGARACRVFGPPLGPLPWAWCGFWTVDSWICDSSKVPSPPLLAWLPLLIVWVAWIFDAVILHAILHSVLEDFLPNLALRS